MISLQNETDKDNCTMMESVASMLYAYTTKTDFLVSVCLDV